MRAIWAPSLLVVVMGCSSAPPPETTPSIPFVALDSMIIERITPDALRIDQLIFADSAMVNARRGTACAAADSMLDRWAEGANAFNGAVALGAHLRGASAPSRVLHTASNAAVYALGGLAGIWALDELSQPNRDFGKVKIVIGAGAFIKFIDAIVWRSAAQDARTAADIAEKIEALGSGANSLTPRIMSLRGRCRNPVFESQVRDLKSFQLGLVGDFVNLVDRIPARYAPPHMPLMNYRQRLRWYEVRTTLGR